MNVKHHSPGSSSARPLDALLASYAAGALPEALHVLVGSHIDLAPQSGKFVGELEALAGGELQRQAPASLPSRDRMLDAIMSDRKSVAPPEAATDDPVFTPTLRRYLGFSSDQIKWRRVMPGVRECLLHDKDGVEAKLYAIKAGRRMPSHTHEGQEFTLVLKGGFSDVSGHYMRGDVAVADEDVDHRPVADEGEDCICFAVTDAPLRLTGPVGKVFQSLFRN
jgi:putative transcriptional regulator